MIRLEEDDEYPISPEVWQIFDQWYGDKSYRHAGMVVELEAAVRKRVAADILTRGATLRNDEEEPISRDEWDCYGDAARIAEEGPHA
ncbi:hypothetical protein ACFUGD_01220 [Streptomyces sp. NPDC057217]|uniref:hypothetical protein n=1 Tax=Streptomyces sp. NPDC057217 TaxID=3346054 RepID=UPI00363C587E